MLTRFEVERATQAQEYRQALEAALRRVLADAESLPRDDRAYVLSIAANIHAAIDGTDSNLQLPEAPAASLDPEAGQRPRCGTKPPRRSRRHAHHPIG